MGLSLIILFAVIGSLWVWGVVRTALWLLPGLCFAPLLPPFSAAIFSFILVASMVAPYAAGGFDFRSLEKQNWAVILFLSGVSAGALLYTIPVVSPLFSICVGAFYPFVVQRVFRLIRQPLSYFYAIPKFSRWIFVALWIIGFSLQWRPETL